jgi:hypothetical protein
LRAILTGQRPENRVVTSNARASLEHGGKLRASGCGGSGPRCEEVLVCGELGAFAFQFSEPGAVAFTFGGSIREDGEGRQVGSLELAAHARAHG